MREKTERNIKIYLEKFGLEKLGDKKPTRKPKTYRQLMIEYNLCLSALQAIVKRYVERYGKPLSN